MHTTTQHQTSKPQTTSNNNSFMETFLPQTRNIIWKPNP
jgi:hypothetical protein